MSSEYLFSEEKKRENKQKLIMEFVIVILFAIHAIFKSVYKRRVWMDNSALRVFEMLLIIAHNCFEKQTASSNADTCT